MIFCDVNNISGLTRLGIIILRKVGDRNIGEIK